MLLTLFVSACTSVRLVSDYDEVIDHGISDLQKSTETFFTKLNHTGRPAGPLRADEQAFLDQTHVAITALQIRAAAVAENSITSGQLEILQDSVTTLGQLLPAGVTAEQVRPAQDAFNHSTGAILKFELAKKRGASVPPR